MKNIYLFIAILGFSIGLQAQAPEVNWKKTYFGQEFNGEVIDVTNISAIAQNLQGQFLLGGSATTNPLLVDENGTILNHFITSQESQVFAVKPTVDGGFIFIVNGGSDYSAVKISDTFGIEWELPLQTNGSYWVNDIIENPNGSFTFVGTTNDEEILGHSGNHYDGWIGRISASGTLQWQKAMGHDDAGDYFDNIIVSNDGRYFITGGTNTEQISGHNGGDNYDVWVLEVNSSGDMVWENLFGGPRDEGSLDIIINTDGNLIVHGYVSQVEDYDVFLARLSTGSGALLNYREYGGSGNEYAGSVIQTTDGGYIFASTTNSIDGDIGTPNTDGYLDMWVVKTYGNLNLQWDKSIDYSDQGGLSAYARSMVKTQDGGFLLGGYTGLYDPEEGNYSSAFLVKIGGTMGVDDLDKHSFQLYPNPAKDFVNLKGLEKGTQIRILDLSGKLIHAKTTTSETVQIHLQHLNSGVYIVETISKGIKTSKKLIVK